MRPSLSLSTEAKNCLSAASATPGGPGGLEIGVGADGAVMGRVICMSFLFCSFIGPDRNSLPEGGKYVFFQKKNTGMVCICIVKMKRSRRRI
jgi:hypothetical protein